MLTFEQLQSAILTEPDKDNLSDGYHSYNELYDHRRILFSIICAQHPDKAWKSKLHADGTMFEDMFIVGINTPQGQFTYHYFMDNWDEFPVNELNRAPEYDGHTPADIVRLRSLVQKPV